MPLMVYRWAGTRRHSMKRRRTAPDDSTPRGSGTELRAARIEPPEDAECCALLRPPPRGRRASAERPQALHEVMNRARRG